MTASCLYFGLRLVDLVSDQYIGTYLLSGDKQEFLTGCQKMSFFMNFKASEELRVVMASFGLPLALFRIVMSLKDAVFDTKSKEKMSFVRQVRVCVLVVGGNIKYCS